MSAASARVSMTVEAGLLRAAPARALAARAERMLDTLGLQRVEVSLALVGDDTIKKLNKTWRKKDKATDVLSFPQHAADLASIYEAAAVSDVLLGDVVISVPTAEKQAKQRKIDFAEEADTLLAHGLLHLLGFDHKNDADERSMNAFVKVLEAAAKSRGPLPFRLTPQPAKSAKSKKTRR